jgi:hypothetical protein
MMVQWSWPTLFKRVNRIFTVAARHERGILLKCTFLGGWAKTPKELERLKAEHNGGKPFPKRDEDLKGGRPIR